MSIRRAEVVTISFPLIDNTNRPARKSGITLVAGDCKVSKDGGSYANSTNLPAEIGSTGRYSLALTATEMNAKWIHVYVSRSDVDDMDLPIGTAGNPSGTCLTNGSNTSSTFLTDLTDSTNDVWKDNLLLFTTGTLAGQVKKISAYNGTTKFVTLATAFTSAPSNGDRFVLVNL